MSASQLNFFNFFKFIDRCFGGDVKQCFKNWIVFNKRIIATKCKIFFLRECKRVNLVPQHLFKYTNNVISFFDDNSSSLYKNFVRGSIRRLLQIEIYDAFRLLRCLQYNVLRCSKILFRRVPVRILNEFIRRQRSSLNHFNILENKRINNKLKWIAKKQPDFLRPNVPLIKYFCSVPPPILP